MLVHGPGEEEVVGLKCFRAGAGQVQALGIMALGAENRRSRLINLEEGIIPWISGCNVTGIRVI